MFRDKIQITLIYREILEESTDSLGVVEMNDQYYKKSVFTIFVFVFVLMDLYGIYSFW